MAPPWRARSTTPLELRRWIPDGGGGGGWEEEA
jgi:hypothetical protein